VGGGELTGGDACATRIRPSGLRELEADPNDPAVAATDDPETREGTSSYVPSLFATEFQPLLDIVVQVELVWMRTQGDGITFVLLLVADPGIQEILREDSALKKEVMVFAERFKRLLQRAGR